MKICPKCGKVLSYNSYFGGYICADCKWENADKGKKRNMGVSIYPGKTIASSLKPKKSLVLK